MPEWEALLEEIAQRVLGKGVGDDAPKTLEALRRSLPRWGLELPLPTWSEGRPVSGSAWDLLPGSEVRDPPKEDPEARRRLRECQERLKKKDHQLQDLTRRLQGETSARQKAERERDLARQEQAGLRRHLDDLKAELSRLQQELVQQKAETARVQGSLEDALRKQERLLEALSDAEKRAVELQARVERLEAELEEKEDLLGRYSWIQAHAEKLPEPFPAEALLRVLVLDYPHFANQPQDRLLALVEGYRSLKKGEVHAVFREHSNLELLGDTREGLVLLGVEVFLEDLARLPLDRWLRTYALRIQSFLDLGSSEKGG